MVASSPLAGEQEAKRLAKLASFAILDTPSEPDFDAAVALARRLTGCPIAVVSLVAADRQWPKALCGTAEWGGTRDQSFCGHAIAADDMLVVEDASADPRFAHLPLVTGAQHIRFYAGVPLHPRVPDIAGPVPAVGTLCVSDTRPRILTDEERRSLRELGDLVASLLEARGSAHRARSSTVAVQRKNRQLAQAERMTGIGTWRLDLCSHQVEWSEQVFSIYGLPPGGPPELDRALGGFLPADRARLADLIDAAARHRRAFDFEGDFEDAAGRFKRVRSIGEPEGDGPDALIGVFQDVTDRHLNEQRLRASANTDALTGLANRGCFEARLEDAMVRARADGGGPLALLLIDLDGFKGVNDTLGHDAGDEVLREMARRLRGPAHRHSFAARLGGDEFVMLLERPRDCAVVEGKVASLLADLRHVVDRGGERRPVSATVGAALLDPEVRDGFELMRLADRALYRAKRHERGTGCLHGSDDVIRPAQQVLRRAG